MMPIKGICNEYKGGLNIDGGEFSLGQSQWKYKNGNFIVYGGEEGKIYYMLFSSLPFGFFDAFDYAPNKKNKTGSFEIQLNNKITTYNFQTAKILLVFVSEKVGLCHDYVQISSKEWKELMQKYANTLNTEDYFIIHEYFTAKTRNCR